MYECGGELTNYGEQGTAFGLAALSAVAAVLLLASRDPWLVIVGGGASYDGYIKILDITDPRVPTQVKSQVISYPIGSEAPGYPNMPLDQGKPQRLKVAGRYAFVAIHGAASRPLSTRSFFMSRFQWLRVE